MGGWCTSGTIRNVSVSPHARMCLGSRFKPFKAPLVVVDQVNNHQVPPSMMALLGIRWCARLLRRHTPTKGNLADISTVTKVAGMVTNAALSMFIAQAAMELHYAKLSLRSASRTKDLATQGLPAINRKKWVDGVGRIRWAGGRRRAAGSSLRKPALPDPILRVLQQQGPGFPAVWQTPKRQRRSCRPTRPEQLNH